MMKHACVCCAPAKAVVMNLNMVDACCEKTANCYTNPPSPSHPDPTHAMLSHTLIHSYDGLILMKAWNLKLSICPAQHVACDWLRRSLISLPSLTSHSVPALFTSLPVLFFHKKFHCKWKCRHTFSLQFDDCKLTAFNKE